MIVTSVAPSKLAEGGHPISATQHFEPTASAVMVLTRRAQASIAAGRGTLEVNFFPQIYEHMFQLESSESSPWTPAEAANLSSRTTPTRLAPLAKADRRQAAAMLATDATVFGQPCRQNSPYRSRCANRCAKASMGVVSCSPDTMSRTTTVPASSSRSPSTRAYRAPDELAAFIAVFRPLPP